MVHVGLRCAKPTYKTLKISFGVDDEGA